MSTAALGYGYRHPFAASNATRRASSLGLQWLGRASDATRHTARWAADAPVPEFPAAGFAAAYAASYLTVRAPVVSGMPIGGVDTGCIDVETSGLLGYRTIFNSHVPRGGPINQPFLGMTLDSNTWVLTTGKAKSYHEPRVAFSQIGEPVPICEPAPLSAIELAPARAVGDVVYWGHYPMLELEFVSDAPVAVSATIWNPFIPGDLTSSTLPGAVFAVELSNRSDSQQEGHLIFSFPGPTAEEAGGGTTGCDVLRGGVSGISLSKSECQLAVGVAGRSRQPSIWVRARVRWVGLGSGRCSSFHRLVRPRTVSPYPSPSACRPALVPSSSSLSLGGLHAGGERVRPMAAATAMCICTRPAGGRRRRRLATSPSTERHCSPGFVPGRRRSTTRRSCQSGFVRRWSTFST